MKCNIAIGVCLALSACSSVEKRTKYTDKTMTIAIDPRSVASHHLARLQQALVVSGKWIVLDDMSNAGGIVIASTQCQTQYSFFTNNPYQRCLQTVSVVEASSKEILAQVTNTSEGDSNDFAPPWDATVEMLNEAFPTHFDNRRTASK